jgi:hypothetical protein
MNLKHKFWTLVAKWNYRRNKYNEVCCCGNGITKYCHRVLGYYYRCSDHYCPSRCAKEYAITSYVGEKMR